MHKTYPEAAAARLLTAGSMLSILIAAPAIAQEQQQPSGSAAGASEMDILYDEADDIVVTGQRLRGSVIGDIPPENQLNPLDIRATGATDVTELLEALAPQLGSARGRGGERPILLLNGQRISSFRELRDIPSEAIARVEILPEEVALKYGYRADQRVVNFVLRPRFRSTVAQIEGLVATEGGYAGGELDLDRLMIGENSRTTISLDAEANGALTEAERDIVRSDDPGAQDERPFRTLVGSRELLRATAVANRMIGQVGATATAELEHVEGRSLLGLSDVLPEALVRRVTSDSGNAGLVLNGNLGRWRWSATGNAGLSQSVTRSDRDDAVDDRARSRRSSAEADLMVNGPLLALPAGDMSATFRGGASTLHLDSSRRRAETEVESDLGRGRGFLAANLDLPVSRRNGDFRALGNLTFNLNGEIEQLSDFGSLATYGAGMNWSPLDRLNLIASWTREEGAPGIEQLGNPLIDTPDTRVFDFSRGETVLATVISGGNPLLDSDRRTVLKVGGNWRPFEERDLRLRAEFVKSRITDPISSLAGPTAALEAAFPDRFVRDASGALVSADLRPVNFSEARRDTLRWGFDFSKPLRSRSPSREQIERFRQARQQASAPEAEPAGAARPAAPGGPEEPPSPPPETEGSGSPAPDAASAGRGGGRGRGGFGGFGRNANRGRLQLSVTHVVNLRDEVTIAPGLPELDFLDGDPIGSTGGRPRHELEAQGGWSNNGLGMRLSGNWRSGTEVESAIGEDLRFSPLATLNLRLFANLGQQFDLVARHPWLRGSSVRLQVENLFDTKPRVRNLAGEVPTSYQPDLLDPLGRTVSLSFRKLFLPRRSFSRRAANSSDQD